MRKILITSVIAGVALALVGAAVARLNASGTASVSATFSATTAEGFKARLCNGPDGQYQLIDAAYRGTSSNPEPSLSGDVRVRIQSSYNTTEKIGWAYGWLKFHDSRWIRFDAVNTNGKLVGLVHGRVGDRSTDLLGSFTADFAPAGISNFQLGGGGSIPSAALIAGRICTGPPVGKSVKLTVKGTIDTVTPTSVSVKPEDSSAVQTCLVGPGSPSVSGFASGQRVEMSCATVNGNLTVVRIKKRG